MRRPVPPSKPPHSPRQPATPPTRSLASARPSPRTARQLAFAVLDGWDQAAVFPTQRLDELSPALPAMERPLAMELVYGILRRQSTLDALVRASVNRPTDQVEPALWTLLRIGAYQLAFLDAIPVHAAVNETVELARHVAEPRWTGFLNAVLRRTAELMTPETTAGPAADALPRNDGSYRRLSSPVFADPAAEPIVHLATAFSLPRWLVDRWLRRHPADEIARLSFWFNAPSPVWIRVNALKTTREGLQSELQAAGVATVAGAHPMSLRLERAAGIESLPGFSAGHFTVQDESAMHAATLLDPKPGELVLDLCSAPGTKTTHLAELMQNSGRIVATDVRADRLERVRENVARLGMSIVETQLVREDAADLPDELFDAVLLDVPCSNTGVLGRRPEVRWRLSTADLRELAEIQTRLIAAAAKRVKPGGRLVYSTCSFEPEENQGVVRGLLDRRRDYTFVRERLHNPGLPADGGYQALLTRKPA